MTIKFCSGTAQLQSMRRLRLMTLPPIPDLDLTTNEHIIFGVLYANLGDVVTRDQLMCALYSDEGPWPRSNVLQVLTGRLRAKVKGAYFIDAIPGVGYRMDPRL